MSTASNRSVSGNQRYRKGLSCPICGGSEDDERGTGRRCYGFLGGDRKYAHCSREDRAVGIAQTPGSETYAHKLHGPCKCGLEHGPAEMKAPRVGKPKKSRSPIDREYDYRDESGALLFQVLRYKDKTFFQRHPTDKGGWKWGIVGIRRVLYRLPELLAADPASPVFVVEGEKDVENLRAVGLVATCNPMGTGGGWSEDYSRSLAGRVVYVVADNDDKGRDHARKVAGSLVGVASEVKWLDLAETARDLGLGELAEKGDASDFLAMGGTADVLELAFIKAPTLKIVRDEEPAGVAETKDARPQIEINTERHLAVEAAIVALRADPDLYNRLGMLASVAREKDDDLKLTGKTRMRNTAGTPKIIELSESIIGTRLTKYASFYAWKKSRSGEESAVDVHPPDWLIRSVATRKYWEGIRPLDAVVECPFPRPDGSIVATIGYDPETATLYAPSIDFPEIPARPSRDDARAAWGRIASHFRHFPFATEDDRVVVLAGMLTVISRPAIEGPVPGVAVIGNKAGTGKGLLIDGMTMPGTGRPAPTSSYPEDKEEATKVKVAIALSARSVVHFDNLDEGSLYGNSALDSALTAPTVDDRVLGASKLVGELRLRASWFLSGNNINPCKDAYRRWLVCNLLTELEEPERRDDLGEESFRSVMLSNRGEIVRDALTILRAHTIEGRPGPGWGPLGSFEDWDRIVRRAVWFATDRDCLVTQRKTAEDSQDRRDKIALLEGWRELPGGDKGLTTNEAYDLVVDSPGRFPTLWSVMIRLGQAGKPMTSRSLGSRFRGLKNSRIAGLMVRDAGERNHTTLWAVDADGSSDGRRTDGMSGHAGCLLPTIAENLHSHSDPITYQSKCKTYGNLSQTHPVHPDIPLPEDNPAYNWGPAY